MIFSDAKHLEMCRLMPTTPEKFLEVKGVSNIKLGKYGYAFMNVIKEYVLSDKDKDKKYDSRNKK